MSSAAGLTLLSVLSLLSVYVYATEDEILTPDSRRWAARNVFGLDPVELASGHFPMLKAPVALADLLGASLLPAG